MKQEIEIKHSIYFVGCDPDIHFIASLSRDAWDLSALFSTHRLINCCCNKQLRMNGGVKFNVDFIQQ